MSQKSQGNPQSKGGMSRARPGSKGGKDLSDYVGSSKGNDGIRIPVPNHNGMADNEGKPSSPGG